MVGVDVALCDARVLRVAETMTDMPGKFEILLSLAVFSRC